MNELPLEEWADVPQTALQVFRYKDGSLQLAVDPDEADEPILAGVYVSSDEIDDLIDLLQYTQ